MSEELRELDAEVAEKVMGYTRCSTTPHPTDNRAINGVLYVRNGFGDFDYGGLLNAVPEYTRDIAAAMEVAMCFQKQGYMVSLNASSEGGWWCCLYPPVGEFIESETVEMPALAICRAALQSIAAKPETKTA